ncbi:hypothetical protein PV11_05029 [Exophiala sideris]|uniref:Glycosyl transferase family 25 domain-containing protein n=1 Tax=Exophiala sideris TaxID=1016849 RepID=A0A0D1YJA4_9EURO|nr:hypothetical protein PV11_05029 [Exophiala sideris]
MPTLTKYSVSLGTIFAVGVILHLCYVGFSGDYGLEEGAGVIRNPIAGSMARSDLLDVYNETLGFQDIFVISLPERSDKRDAISVQAALTNISFTLEDAILSADVAKKARPHGMEMEGAEVGCWRSHLNVMQNMVHNRIQSVLILEDDADWDVAIKPQMHQFARGTRWLLDIPENAPSHSPYGDGWDVLWIGHCSMHSHDQDKRRFVIPNDPTVHPPDKRDMMLLPDMSPWDEGPDANNKTRVMFQSAYGFCSAAWAISLAGAEKIIYELSMKPFDTAIDNGVGGICGLKKHNATCIAPFPPIVGVSKPAGGLDKGSDIRVEGDAADIREKATSERVVFSTRLNIDRLLNGSTEFESLYPESTGQFMSLKDIGSAVGHGEWVDRLNW